MAEAAVELRAVHGEAEEIAPFIGTLLGVQPVGEDEERVKYLEPPQLRGKVFEAVKDYVEMLAADRPVALVFEDLHWTNPTSLDLIIELMSLTDRAPVMILAVFRPQTQDPSWRLHEVAARDYAHRYVPVALEPLNEDESRKLVGDLLHVEDLPEKVRALILSKAEGNPFFVLRIADASGDMPMQVSALNKLGFVSGLMQGELPEAESHLVDAERRANECEDIAGLAELHMTYCYIRTATGDFENAEDHLRDAARIGAEQELEEPRLFGLSHTANTLTYMTRFDEAWQVAQEAREEAERLGNRRYLSEVLAFTLPLNHLQKGDLDAAHLSVEEGVDMAAGIGAIETEGTGAYMLGSIAWLRGEYEQAIQHQEHAVQICRGIGASYQLAAVLCSLGMSYLDVSSELADKTMELHTEALGELEKPLGNMMGALAWADLGFCALALGDADRAKGFFEMGLTIPTGPRLLARPQLLVLTCVVD